MGEPSAQPSAPGGLYVAPPGMFPEARYQESLAAIRDKKRWPAGLVMILSLGLFVLLQQDRSLTSLGLLVGVLFFHELGHYAGMQVFGYRDVRMFFIPLFGAAVAGKPRGVAPWKEGVVLLLGPVPGIVAAFVLARQGRDTWDASSLTRQLAVSLVSINAFNLLPLGGLDGARLLQHVLFSRRRWLEVGFQLCAALGLGLFALQSESYALGFLAYLMIAVLPHRWRVLGGARRVREAGVALPLDARDLTDDVGRQVFTVVDGLFENRPPRYLGPAMEQLVDAANDAPPSVGASLALLLTWLVALAFTAVTLVMVFAPPGASQTDVEEPVQLLPMPPHARPGPGGLRLGGDEEFNLRAPGQTP